MKKLVVYSSQSGNTQKLAQTVYETLDGDKAIHSAANAPDPADYDFIAVGFWFQAGKPDPKASEYMARIGSGKTVFLFATHGAAPDSDHAAAGMKHAESLVSAATIAGTFNCQGAVNPRVIEKVSARPEPPDWIDDAPAAAGHPDADDLATLKSVVKSLQGG